MNNKDENLLSNSNNMQDKILNFFRWLMFLPAALVAYFVSFYLIAAINIPSMARFGLGGIIDTVFILILSHGWSAAIFVWVGVKIAPKNNFIVSIIMGMVYAILLGIVVAYKIIYGGGFSSSWLEIVTMAVAGIIAVIAMISYFKSQENKASMVGSPS